MAKSTFMGGIHLYTGKTLSKDKPVMTVLPKGELVYPLSRHTGTPATPIVLKGDHVLQGQKIAEASSFESVPVYAAVSGTVKEIETRRAGTGEEVMSIVIENDGLYEETEYPKYRPYEELSREEIIEIVREAGIVGMSGEGFPTFIKLSPKEPDKIDYVIANCAECEPYLTSDYRRMMEEPEKLIGGLKILLRLFQHAKGILAVEDHKPDAVALLKKLTKDEPDIMVTPLRSKYPQGAERSIIYATVGRAINSSMTPADAGCIVENVETIVAIYHAVTEGKPLMQRLVTVTGDAVNNPRNFLVRIGMMCDELIEEAGGFKKQPAKVISGGPMMGFDMPDLHVPIIRTSTALLCLLKDGASEMEQAACIRCGRCVEACPQRLVPSKLMKAAVQADSQTFLKLNGAECIGCGCCSYVCPAKRLLTQSISAMQKTESEKAQKQGGKNRE